MYRCNLTLSALLVRSEKEPMSHDVNKKQTFNPAEMTMMVRARA